MKIGYRFEAAVSCRPNGVTSTGARNIVLKIDRSTGIELGCRVQGKRITLTQSARNPFIFSPGTPRPRVTLRVIRENDLPPILSPHQPASLSFSLILSLANTHYSDRNERPISPSPKNRWYRSLIESNDRLHPNRNWWRGSTITRHGSNLY